MKVAVLGTGMVGRTLSAAFAAAGHDVTVGTRDVAALPSRSADFAAWHAEHGDIAVAPFDAAAAAGEFVVNATAGTGSLAALTVAGAANLGGKVLIDVANALDFSAGMPPTLAVANTDSLGEQIQRAFPDTRVVKALNTVNASVMVDPTTVAGGDHDIFVCGNDAEAKAFVTSVLRDWFGWRSVVDLGDITAARGMEMYLPLWLRLMGAAGHPSFNIKIIQ